MNTPLLDVRGLHLCSKQNPDSSLVSDITFSLSAGATLGIVGESGSGKSLTLRALTSALPRGINIASGDIKINGIHTIKNGRALKKAESREIGMVFQNPMNALNPLMRTGALLAEIHRVNTGESKAASKEKAVELLQMVGISDARRSCEFFPHQLSGGQRQRIVLAAALAKNPRILLCDEPTTALDTFTQTQIVQLIKSLCRERNIAVIFVSHDLSVVSQLCERICVMKDGELIESGQTKNVLNNPQQHYTRKLIDSQRLLEGDRW
ncbi:ABC transporter ATP-binding protein [Pectobacterium araliae]|uniref:ABC transporter ATP-binding protein n=1 Tax=Pectobacterium araliae TaxID=3073862 RepID=A0AAN0KME6_9GAMM|nr:ABC transporter ATP-binding protein [Pectobacterium sp. MAFF 302110]GKW21610.1 ABC transporter ATP-binding protein [Pectobacterium carotovorum subsp. carotovorum]